MIPTFFVRCAVGDVEERWRRLFDLAWSGRGLTVDLTQAPDWVLKLYTEWTNKNNAEEKAQIEQMRRAR